MQTALKSTTPAVSATATAYIGVPPGTVVSYFGQVAPDGWLLCVGQSIDRQTYPALFDLIGKTVPDLRGRCLIGAGNGNGLSSRALAQTGGEERHTLTLDEMPAHTHSMGIGGGNQGNSPGTGNSEGYASTSTSFIANSSSQGKSASHENMPPFYVLNYLIKF